MWDLTTALDQYHANMASSSVCFSVNSQGAASDKGTTGTKSADAAAANANAMLLANRPHTSSLQVGDFHLYYDILPQFL